MVDIGRFFTLKIACGWLDSTLQAEKNRGEKGKHWIKDFAHKVSLKPG
jgi:hypothetical protein